MIGNRSFKLWSPAHLSSQNLTFWLLPIWTFVNCSKSGNALEINFHGLLNVVLRARPASHPFLWSPYLLVITFPHRDSFSLGNPHHHFPSRALFLRRRLPIPKPPNSFGFVTTSQETKWDDLSLPKPSHKKSLIFFSRISHTPLGILKRDI